MLGNFALQNMSPLEVQTALESEAIVLIDVREPHEFAQEHIAGAQNFPLSQFNPLSLPQVEGRYLVFSCAAGVRSVRALEQCRSAGLDVAHHLQGGLNAWKGAGLATQ